MVPPQAVDWKIGKLKEGMWKDLPTYFFSTPNAVPDAFDTFSFKCLLIAKLAH